MQSSTQDKLKNVLFIRGSVQGLLKIARNERLEMLQYLLEMVHQEAQTLKLRLEEDIAKRD